MYNRLLASDNYVLKRQGLKLLSEFLLDRENFRIMMRYIRCALATLLLPMCLSIPTLHLLYFTAMLATSSLS